MKILKTILLNVLGGIVRKEHSTNKGVRQFLNLFTALVLITMVSTSCKKLLEEFPSSGGEGVSAANNYMQTNLVSDTAGFHAARIDPTLSNAWGITINPSGIF